MEDNPRQRRELYYYLDGALNWSTHTLVGNVRHAIHLIDENEAEELRGFQAGLKQMLQGLEKLQKAIPQAAAKVKS